VRLLIAKAVVEGLTLLTADALLATYPGPAEKI
jgi:PIN domain nuclease of toxin-antitoxin system